MALLIVDVQNDFCPGGALGVAGGDRIIPVINRYIELLGGKGALVITSRDWHPPVTRHFQEFGGLWPAHCVAGTRGAMFHEGLALPPDSLIFSKGMDPERDDYSALSALDAGETPLSELLRQEGIGRLYVCGLATDYCVRQTTLDALNEGLEIVVLTDAVAGVDLAPGDSKRALAEMRAGGARLADYAEVAADD
ncbi:MAG TPA: nicotinamidase [Geobacteraceae bacterium]|nr:nicotinamidase [Geobacteraceae bacterium]